MKIISLTALGLREHDKWGSGLWKAPRKKLVKNGGEEWVRYPHPGADYKLCEPGEELEPAKVIYACTWGKFVREVFPYGWKSHYRGMLIRNEFADFFMMYFRPYTRLHIGDKLSIGQPVGLAQDISKKDPAKGKYDGMIPHIHLGVLVHGRNMLSGKAEYINPETLM